MLIIKSPQIVDLINKINIKEKLYIGKIFQLYSKKYYILILGSSDHKISSIYQSFVKKATNATVFYVIYGTCGISLYFITPFLAPSKEPENNSTIKQHNFIFSSWFPFDPNLHYGWAYTLQLLGGFYGYAYIVYGGAFFFCMLIFCSGQLNILQYVLRNFTKFAHMYEKNHNVSYGDAQRVIIRLIMMDHQEIIQ